jgi:hypothetical protein
VKTHGRLWRALPAILLTATATVATACGGGTTTKTVTVTESQAASSSTATTEDTAVTTASAPEPEPVKVLSEGPFVTHRDQVKLHGSVSPAGAKVRVNGHRAAVVGRRWTMLVRMTKKGDNTFRIVATKSGHDGDRTSAIVTRELSAAEKAAARAARKQTFMASVTTPPYNQILAHPSRFEGTKVRFSGEIFQVQEDGGTSVILLSVTDEGYGFWDDHVWIDYHGSIRGAEGDHLTVYGTLTGTESYDTQAGGNTTVPSMRAKYVEE